VDGAALSRWCSQQKEKAHQTKIQWRRMAVSPRT